MEHIPRDLYIDDPPFYEAHLARIPPDDSVPEVFPLSSADSDPNNDLALPISIVWLGDAQAEEKCGGADLDDDGTVGLPDLAIVALQWMRPPGVPSADLAPSANQPAIVDLEDFSVMAAHWGKVSCIDDGSVNPKASAP
jgi:hypothetical protein